jgi:hypothetical protein
MNENDEDDDMDEGTSAVPTTIKVRTCYAIWIRGQGWLRPINPSSGEIVNDPFSTFELNLAQAALHLYGDGAEILPFDDSMMALEPLFLKREQARADKRMIKNLFGLRTPTRKE